MSKKERLFKEYMKLSRERLKLWGKRVEGTLTQKEIDNLERKAQDLQREIAMEEAKEYERRKKERARREKGGCFISTTVITALGYEDDCAELTLLRSFRDRILLSSSEGRRMVEDYYAISPELTDILVNEGAQKPNIYQDLYVQFLIPVLSHITSGHYAQAIALYRDMLRVIYDLPQKSAEVASSHKHQWLPNLIRVLPRDRSDIWK